MRRVQLFEFGDQDWLPAFLRNYMTDFLQFGANRFDVYREVIPLIRKGIEKSGSSRILDLASGGGGGHMKICEHLKEDFPELKITLTDLYPNHRLYQQLSQHTDCFEYVTEPVDATHVPGHLQGFRTLFLSFHHFPPDSARQILQDAVDQKACLGIFESQERSAPSLTAMFFSPLTLWLMTPMIRPFSFRRILFTYFLPLLPIMVWWDGIVSSLRTYSVEEMQELISSLSGHENYDWDVGKVKSGPAMVLYLLAYPK